MSYTLKRSTANAGFLPRARLLQLHCPVLPHTSVHVYAISVARCSLSVTVHQRQSFHCYLIDLTAARDKRIASDTHRWIPTAWSLTVINHQGLLHQHYSYLTVTYTCWHDAASALRGAGWWSRRLGSASALLCDAVPPR